MALVNLIECSEVRPGHILYIMKDRVTVGNIYEKKTNDGSTMLMIWFEGEAIPAGMVTHKPTDKVRILGWPGVWLAEPPQIPVS